MPTHALQLTDSDSEQWSFNGVLLELTLPTRIAAEHNLNLMGPKDSLEELRGVNFVWRPFGAFYPTFPAAPY
jgi:hypothetical protein